MWFLGLVVMLIVGILYLNTRKPKNYPPGPKWLPIIGCALEVQKVRAKCGYLYQTVNELTKKYSPDGHLLGLKIGQDKIIMVNSAEANKEMLFSEDFDGRPYGIFFLSRTWGERLGIIFTDGELWKEQRRFLIRHLKDFGLGRAGMSEIASCEGKHMVEDVMKLIIDSGKDSAVLQMQHFFNIYTLNILWTMMAGIRYNPTDPEMAKLQELLFDIFAAVDMVGALFSHFPFLSVIAPDLSGYKEFMRTHRQFWDFLRKEVKRHKENFDPNKEDCDFMDAYLRVLHERGEVTSYSEGQLVALCMDMFMAGSETTAKSMSFCFSYLVREQEVQKKTQEEIDRVIGRERLPNINDHVDMPYSQAVVHECIRHIMGRTFALPHRALKDTTLVGYNIPKASMVVSNFTNVLMDENFFPDPYTFKPERFLKDGKIVLPDNYFPFGLAKRRCMGDRLAKCSIFIFTTTMLQRFSFLPAPGEPLPSLEHVDGATPSAAPFKALVIPRF